MPPGLPPAGSVRRGTTPVRALPSIVANTSSRVILPPAPEPTISDGSSPCSAISRRTTGDKSLPGPPWEGALGGRWSAGRDPGLGGAPVGGLAGACAAWPPGRRPPAPASTVAGSPGPPSASVPVASNEASSATPLSGSSISSAPDLPFAGKPGEPAEPGAAPWPVAVGVPLWEADEVAPGWPMTASFVPTETVSPSGTRTSVTVPLTGEGTSESTLSVETSNRTSSSAIASPTRLCHFVMVPSVTVSPSWGIVMSANVKTSSC